MNDVTGTDMLVILFVVAFGLDRVVAGTLFALSFLGPWARRFPEPHTMADLDGRKAAERRLKLVYFALALVLAAGALALWGNVRLFAALGLSVPMVLDVAVTGLILVGGSDFIGRLVQISGLGNGGQAAVSRPVEITGRLILEDSSARRGEPRDGA